MAKGCCYFVHLNCVVVVIHPFGLERKNAITEAVLFVRLRAVCTSGNVTVKIFTDDVFLLLLYNK